MKTKNVKISEIKVCECNNIKIGSYDRQISVINPFTKKVVCIDICLIKEIAELWFNKIETIESCCGHNVFEGYILVPNSQIKKMKKLGYKNTAHLPDRKEIFCPKYK